MPPITTNQIPTACFAPPLTDEKLAEYKRLASGCQDAEVKDAMETLLKCVEKWWELPESKRKDGDRFSIVHKGKKANYEVTPLEEDHVKELWEVTPWMRELNLLSNGADNGLFDKIPGGSLRNAAFHLLWLCKEITLDREPLTQDKLG